MNLIGKSIFKVMSRLLILTDKKEPVPEVSQLHIIDIVQ